MAAVIQNGELEFPQELPAQPQLPAYIRFKEPGDLGAIDELALLLRQEFLGYQPVDLLADAFFVSADLKVEVLHGPVHSTAIGPPVPGFFQKTGGPPDPLGLALLRGILRSLLVLVPALPGSCRLLGGGNRRLRVGIGKGQGLLQGLHGLLRQRLGLLPGSFPGSGLLLYFLRNHTDGPGAAVRRGDLMGLGQVPQLSSLRAVQSRK